MATNQVFNLGPLSLTVTAPTTPASGDPVRLGLLSGVALTDERADGTTSVALQGVFTLSVKGEDGSGNAAIAAGDKVYMDTDNEINADVTNGTFFGYALEAVSSGATTAIKVLIGRG